MQFGLICFDVNGFACLMAKRKKLKLHVGQDCVQGNLNESGGTEKLRERQCEAKVEKQLSNRHSALGCKTTLFAASHVWNCNMNIMFNEHAELHAPQKCTNKTSSTTATWYATL